MTGLQKAIVGGVVGIVFLVCIIVGIHARSGQPPERIGPAIGKPAPIPPSVLAKIPPGPVGDAEKLGLAIVHSEPGAMDKLVALGASESASFKKESAGLDEQHKAELARKTFTPLRVVFEIITMAATNKNPVALGALSQTFKVPDLKGMTVRALGYVAADNGDPKALDVLLHPDKYGVMLSTDVSALKAPADKGNQKAIDFLVAITKDPKDRPLRLMAADGLRGAADAGNPEATDALIALLADKDPSVQKMIVFALKDAAGRQNAKAAQALKSAGVN